MLEPKENNILKKLLNDSYIIASIPIVGYIATFCYQFGRFTFFGIPISFIEINLLNVLTTTTILIIIIFIGSCLSAFLFQTFFSKKDTVVLRELKPFFYLYMFIIILIILYRFDITEIWYLIVTILFISLISLILPLSQKGKTYEEKVYKRKEKIYQKSETYFYIIDYLGENIIKSIIYILMIFMLTYYAGNAIAKYQKEFYIISNESQFLLLEKYSNSLICAKYDKNKDNIIIHKEFKIINLDNENNIELIYKKVKSVKLNK